MDSVPYAQLLSLTLIFYPFILVSRIRTAKGSVKALYAYNIIESVVQLVAVFVLVRYFGLIGVVAGKGIIEEGLARGIGPVAGADEAGVAPWAGPVAAAAVILDPARVPRGLDDSKRLTAERREELFAEICACAEVAVAFAPPARIDRDNILRASQWALAQAVHALQSAVDGMAFAT